MFCFTCEVSFEDKNKKNEHICAEAQTSEDQSAINLKEENSGDKNVILQCSDPASKVDDRLKGTVFV